MRTSPNWNRWTIKKMSKLGLASDGSEELWMTECVCIANRHEHAGEVAPVRSTPYSFQSCPNGPLGVG